jgi:outer membrane protein
MSHLLRGARKQSAMFVLCVLASSGLLAQSTAPDPGALTLDEALAEAHRANAQLPVAQYQVLQAQARAQQARGALYPSLALDGDVHGGAPQAYASNDALTRVLLQAPLYSGGELRAAVKRGEAEVTASSAGFEVSVRDVDLAVRITFGRMLMDEAARDLRQRAIERLQNYLAAVRGRQNAGQAVASDVLRTQQRIAAAQADLAAADRDRGEARTTLNDLLGRAPDGPLSLVALPDPAPPTQRDEQPWLTTPDVKQSDAAVRASQANLEATRGGRRPHVALEAEVGKQWGGAGTQAPYNIGTGAGGQVLLTFSLPIWDNGVFHARIDEAHAALNEAEQRRTVVERATHLAWTQAVNSTRDLYAEYRARGDEAAAARDAYLQTESTYRGGQGSALDVLDAYDAWLQSNQALLDVTYNYRVAQASLIRWGTQ